MTTESDMQKTLTIGPHPHQLLANAVLHLANAVDNPCGIAGVGPSCEAARDLVRDLAAPDHAEKPQCAPAPKRAIAFVRETRTRPDGSLETRERHGYGATAPSCDAPHCDCATGEDCHANVAGATYEDGDGHRRQIAEGFADSRAASSREVRTAVMVLQRALGVGEDGIVGPATMEAIERIRTVTADQDERVMIRAVEPSHPGLADPRDMWVLDPGATGHRAPFSRGDLVVRSSGREGIHQVVDVSVDVDAPHHRSLCLTVKPTDVVVDADAF